jgi:hypothetical protein
MSVSRIQKEYMKKILTGFLIRYATLLLSIMAVTGIFILVTFLQLHSELEYQFLFGLSRRRLVIGVVFIFFLAINIAAIFWIRLKSGKWGLRIENKVLAWVPLGIVFLYFVALATGVILLAMIPPMIGLFKVLRPLSEQLDGLFLWLFILSSFLIVLIKIIYRDVVREKRVVYAVEQFLIAAVLCIAIFFLYEHLLIWTGSENQSRYSYWNFLADEFLKGKLYLENPLQNHDLTLYRGKWYIPMPPLPAILMMPLAYLIGGESINTNNFSIVFSAVNTTLVFLILKQLVLRKWIKLSTLGMVLLALLFAFGTPHLWVGIRGRAWFVSQIVTVTFLALAVLAALRSWSPWLVGISLGLAIAARPNGIMTWPFVFAIAMQILEEEGGTVDLKKILNWSIKSILPMGMAVVGLLFYNHARFENFFDFGYTTINGDAGIVANAQTYGIFSTHFIIPNIKAMFLYFPVVMPGGQWPILPSTIGMNIFLVTPPLIYLFHRYEPKWWIIGAWSSVFFNFVLLVLYHNTGSHQFGYRYILDVMVPLLALLAVALNGKIPWHFILLLFFSIAFNIYGAYWFING